MAKSLILKNISVSLGTLSIHPRLSVVLAECIQRLIVNQRCWVRAVLSYNLFLIHTNIHYTSSFLLLLSPSFLSPLFWSLSLDGDYHDVQTTLVEIDGIAATVFPPYPRCNDNFVKTKPISKQSFTLMNFPQEVLAYTGIIMMYRQCTVEIFGIDAIVFTMLQK